MAQGSCFLTRLSLFTAVMLLAVFHSKERQAKRSPHGVNELSNQEVTQKTNLKVTRTIQGV